MLESAARSHSAHTAARRCVHSALLHCTARFHSRTHGSGTVSTPLIIRTLSLRTHGSTALCVLPYSPTPLCTDPNGRNRSPFTSVKANGRAPGASIDAAIGGTAAACWHSAERLAHVVTQGRLSAWHVASQRRNSATHGSPAVGVATAVVAWRQSSTRGRKRGRIGEHRHCTISCDLN